MSLFTSCDVMRVYTVPAMMSCDDVQNLSRLRHNTKRSVTGANRCRSVSEALTRIFWCSACWKKKWQHLKLVIREINNVTNKIWTLYTFNLWTLNLKNFKVFKVLFHPLISSLCLIVVSLNLLIDMKEHLRYHLIDFLLITQIYWSELKNTIANW